MNVTEFVTKWGEHARKQACSCCGSDECCQLFVEALLGQVLTEAGITEVDDIDRELTHFMKLRSFIK